MSADVGPSARSKPLVSIIVNNYNYGRYLGAAIESALAQTYRPLEVIVVDDGSTDDSRAVLARYGERVRPLLKERGGQASALNAGFAASAGEVVLFLDSDDVLLPEAIAEVVAVWRPTIARTQFPLAITDENGKPTGSVVPSDRLRSGDMRPLLLQTGSYPAVGTSSAYSRRALEQLMPIPEAEWCRQPDLYLLLTSAFCGEVKSLLRPLGLYRFHGANKWARRRMDLERLHEGVRNDVAKERLVREWARRFGFELPDRWLLRGPEHVQGRIASLRLDRARHPFPEDRALALGSSGFMSSLRNTAFSRRKRWLFAAWFLAVAIAPRWLAVRLIDMSFGDSFRPRALQILLHGRGAGAASLAGRARQLERV